MTPVYSTVLESPAQIAENGSEAEIMLCSVPTSDAHHFMQRVHGSAGSESMNRYLAMQPQCDESEMQGICTVGPGYLVCPHVRWYLVCGRGEAGRGRILRGIQRGEY